MNLLSNLNWEDWLNIVAIASIISSAAFAALGLFSEYRDKKGRITLAGRVAAGGIGLSASLSLAANLFEGRRKADEQVQAGLAEQRRAAEVKRQIGKLDVANKNLGELQREAADLQSNMTQTLQGQQEVLQQSKLLTRRTEAVSNRVWQVAYQVEPSELTLHFSNSCLDFNNFIQPAIAIVRLSPRSNSNFPNMERRPLGIMFTSDSMSAKMGNAIFSEFKTGQFHDDAMRTLDHWVASSVYISLEIRALKKFRVENNGTNTLENCIKMASLFYRGRRLLDSHATNDNPMELTDHGDGHVIARYFFHTTFHDSSIPTGGNARQ